MHTRRERIFPENVAFNTWRNMLIRYVKMNSSRERIL